MGGNLIYSENMALNLHIFKMESFIIWRVLLMKVLFTPIEPLKGITVNWTLIEVKHLKYNTEWALCKAPSYYLCMPKLNPSYQN